jgi:hypothetical protein
LPAIHGFLKNLRLNWLQQIFLLLGRYSFMIYLFNTLCIGLAKGILLLTWPWDGANFYGFALALMGAGLLGPMGLKRYAFRHVKAFDRLTD